MRKYILIPVLLISLNSFSQTETTVTHGDSVFRVRYINNYVLDSAIRWNHFTTQINDSTYIKDSTSYMFRFRRITGITKDSVLIPTRLKTVGSNQLVGVGDIPITVMDMAWGSMTGSIAFQGVIDINGNSKREVSLNTINTTITEDVTVKVIWNNAKVGNTISLYQGVKEAKN